MGKTQSRPKIRIIVIKFNEFVAPFSTNQDLNIGQIVHVWFDNVGIKLPDNITAYLGNKKLNWFTKISKIANKTSSLNPLVIVSTKDPNPNNSVKHVPIFSLPSSAFETY